MTQKTQTPASDTTEVTSPPASEKDRAVQALQRKLNKGEQLTERAFETVYGTCALSVLLTMPGVLVEGHRDTHKQMVKTRSGMKEKEKRGPRKFKKGTAALPSIADFKRARDKRYEVTVESQIADAMSEFESLGSEVREAYDNLESANMGNMDRTQRFGEAADALEGLSAPDVPEIANSMTFVFFPSDDLSSRSKRLSDACDRLSSAIDHINDVVANARDTLKEREEAEATLEKLREAKKPDQQAIDAAKNKVDEINKELRQMFGLGDEGEVGEAELDELDDLVNEIESVKSDAESVEFPGMYG